MSMINLEINKKEIIYDGKVKKYGKKGVIPIKEKIRPWTYLCNFPIWA